jgi:hypothetical protein
VTSLLPSLLAGRQRERIILKVTFGNKNVKKLGVILIFAIVIVLIIVFYQGGFFNLKNQGKTEVSANEFSGTVQSVSDKSIIVKGLYISNDESVGTPEELVEVEVLIDPNTSITRETFEIPNTSEAFYPDELPKKQSQVSLNQLSLDFETSVLGIKIRTTDNIFNKKQFTASEITYRLPDLSGE